MPLLLERMNDAASELNSLELQLEQSHARHREALRTWQLLYEELKLKHGRATRHGKRLSTLRSFNPKKLFSFKSEVSGALDHAKPYFDCLRRCQAVQSCC